MDFRIDFLADTVGSGEEPRFFFIKTDATQYSDAGRGFIAGLLPTGGGSTATIQTYQPVVPLPAAALLFGSGLLDLLGIARRRERTVQQRINA